MFFNKNKKIINEAIFDLRKYIPQALENVKLLNSSCVIFSENPSEELITAYSNIKVKNVATTLYLPDDKKIVTFNGVTILNQMNYTPNAIHLFNGMGIIQKIESDAPIEIFSNGMIIYDGSTKINFITQNGLSVYTPFEITNVRLFGHDTKIDSQFIENMPDGSVIATGHNLIIYNDVTLELLKSKQIYFAAGQKIKCDYNILTYVQTIATAGNKIEVNE